jgi:hypothetical protein
MNYLTFVVRAGILKGFRPLMFNSGRFFVNYLFLFVKINYLKISLENKPSIPYLADVDKRGSERIPQSPQGYRLVG